jgi:hypothetical protein
METAPKVEAVLPVAKPVPVLATTLEPDPIATELAMLVPAWEPITTAPDAFAYELGPIATAESCVAVAESPNASASLPDATDASPKADE